MIALAKLTALLIGISIAFAIATIGKKRQIGFFRSLCLGLLNPILALVFTLFSKKNNVPSKKTNIFLKVIAIGGILYGLFFLYGAYTTPINTEPIQKSDIYQKFENDRLSRGGIETGNENQDLYWNEVGSYIGKVLAMGILSLVLDNSTFLAYDYRTARFFRFYLGVLFISIGSFSLWKRKTVEVISNSINAKTFDFKYINGILLKVKGNKSYSKYLAISAIFGVILGWCFRQPNNKLLAKLYNNYESEAKNDLFISVYKNNSFFSSEYFSFNWPVFVISFTLCLAILLFFFDKSIRLFLYKKTKFTEEKNELKNQ